MPVDHYDDLLEVLNFYQQNLLNRPKGSRASNLLNERIIASLAKHTIMKVEADSDITLRAINIDDNKCLNVIQPYLFATSKTA